MSNYNFMKSPNLVQQMIQNEKRADSEFKINNPNSLVITFETVLKKLGYEFETLEQVKNFLPKHKKVIVPIALNLYCRTELEQDKRYFLGLFHYKGFCECIPIMLKDMYSENVSDTIKSLIAENIRVIRSPAYIEDYLNLLSKEDLKDIRNPIIALVGDLKVEKALPLLISALNEGGNITTNALSSLGNFKKSELRIYFEKYLNHENKYYRKEAKKALEKLDS